MYLKPKSEINIFYLIQSVLMLKVSTIDESVGRIVKTLKANGLYENTLIGDY